MRRTPASVSSSASSTPWSVGPILRTVLAIAIFLSLAQISSLRFISNLFDVPDVIITSFKGDGNTATATATRSQWPEATPSGLSGVLKMPPFDTIHDFSTGHRPQRFMAGYSRDDLLQGRGVSFEDNEDGTVDMTTFPAASSTADDSTQRFAGMTREQPSDGYSAAWLVTVDRLLSNGRISLQHLHEAKSINLEFGHFAMSAKSWNLQAVDMFDFFVHHLSYYEKITGRSAELLGDTIQLLEGMQDDYERNDFYNNASKQRNGHTLAIVAYYAAKLNGPALRRSQLFLNITVKTVAAVFPNVVVFVGDPSDYAYVAQSSGLNRYLYDVQLIKDLRSFDRLTYGTSVTAKELLRQNVYSQDEFDFVYYTEADELPHMRDVHYLLRHALQPAPTGRFSSSVIIPHRGQPISIASDVSQATLEAHKKRYNDADLGGKRVVHDVPDLMSSSCCFDRPNIRHGPFVSPQEFISITNSTLELFRQHRSFSHVAGTGNIFKKMFRLCQMSSPRQMCLSSSA